jgi:hypothetical protein
MKFFVLVNNCREADLPGADGNTSVLSLKSADPDLSRSLNQFHLLLKSGTFPKQIYTGSPNPSCVPKTPTHKFNRKIQIIATERELKTRKANPRSNLEPSITIGASDGGTLECRCGRPWSEGKTLTFR